MANVDWLYTNKSFPQDIFIPNSYEELIIFLRNSDNIISVAGEQFSSGGQTLIDNGVILSMKNINSISDIDIDNQEYTVESGSTWENVLSTLTNYGLVPLVMQSYNSFSIGGSISVNGHGRSGRRLSDSIIWLDVILVNGVIKRCSRDKNKLLFYSVIGGYGLIGIIWRARLKSQNNKPIICYVHESNSNCREDIVSFVRECPILYNCGITNNGKIYHCIWKELENHDIDEKEAIQTSNYGTKIFMRIGETLVSMFPSIRDVFQNTRSYQLNGKISLLSNEMGHCAKDLLPVTSSRMLQSLLQEYFLPLENLMIFHEKFIAAIRQYDYTLLNTSVRYVYDNPSTMISFLDYTNFKAENKVAIVYYINIANFTDRQLYYKEFTYKMIELSLSLGGTWYLPYYPAFTRNQLLRGYPFISEFLKIKQKYDPSSRLHSKFYEYIITS